VGDVKYAIILPLYLVAIPYCAWALVSLLKDNPRLRKAMVSLSMWNWNQQSYQRRVMGLDEREKLVVDQAFRRSYQILASVCALLLLFLGINITELHSRVVFHPDGNEILTVYTAAIWLLTYLPATIVAWKERSVFMGENTSANRPRMNRPSLGLVQGMVAFVISVAVATGVAELNHDTVIGAAIFGIMIIIMIIIFRRRPG
jgi:hypothetical protein